MRVSIPNIPSALLNAAKSPSISLDFAVDRTLSFLYPGNVGVLTGAGVSVDSGIRAYRGKDGRYMNPNYKPIFFHELVENSPSGQSFRQRYWARAYLGYPPVLRAQPNPTHYALAVLLHTRHIKQIITQNVDGLHLKASSLDIESTDPRILQLHGSLHLVHCRHRHLVRRSIFQAQLSNANPRWKHMADEFERTGTQPRTNPDGDVDVEGMRFDDFVIPSCDACLKESKTENMIKPSVIFFGESIPTAVRNRSFAVIDEIDRLLVVGTTLATYSAFRLVKHALDAQKPVLLINVGPTRADGLFGVEKIEYASAEVLQRAARTLTSTVTDPEIERLLSSGIISPPTEDDEKRSTRNT